MSNLIPSEVRHEFKIDSEGKATVSLRGAQRLLGLGNSTLIEQFTAARFPVPKIAELLIQKGFDPARFAQEGIPDTAFALIAKHYSKTHPQAEMVYDAFAAIGIRSWIQQELGWSADPFSVMGRFMQECAERIGKLEKQQEQLMLAAAPSEFESANLKEFGRHLTLGEYASEFHVVLTHSDKSKLGRDLVGYCKVNGVIPKKKKGKAAYPIMALAHTVQGYLEMKQEDGNV